MKERFKTSVYIVLATLLALLSKFLPFNLGTYFFDVFVLLIVIIAGYEISNIIEKTNRKINKFLATMYGVYNYITLLLLVNKFKFAHFFLVQFISLAIYGVITFVVESFMYKYETSKEHLRATFNTVLACVYPTFFFGFMLMINHIDAFSGVKYFSLITIILIIAITMLTDTFAYLVGSKLRGPKLCPKISPTKTISGAIGGLIGGVIREYFNICQCIN